MTVNIYIHQTIKGPKRQQGYGIYILEAITLQGPVTKTCKEAVEASENEAWLITLGSALSHMTCPSDLNLFFDSKWLGTALTEWLPKWRETEYLSAKGEKVKNADIWEKVGNELAKHNVTVKVGEPHSYRNWLINNAKTA